MGSPLGVLFADFYMGIVERRVFQHNPTPDIYCRYVDDTFIKTSSPEIVERLRQQFEEHSVLRFTCEESSQGTLPFLDIAVTQDLHTNSIKTDVYRKNTNLGLCLNGISECPDRYKTSTINSYIRRALTHCSSWHSTSNEIEASSQILINNGFTNRDVLKNTGKTIEKWYAGNDNDSQDNEQHHPIKIFYKNQFHRDYKKDEQALRSIINENVKPLQDDHVIKLIIYYKSRKTSSLIMKNNTAANHEKLKERNVIYHFKCPVQGCSQDYIGMTTMRLTKRISCHLQEGAIFNHMRTNHNNRLNREQLIDSIEIIDRNSDQKRLRFLEALHILEKKPSINRTDEPLLLPSLTPPPTHQPRPAA